jgi:hypothetical protein
MGLFRKILEERAEEGYRRDVHPMLRFYVENGVRSMGCALLLLRGDTLRTMHTSWRRRSRGDSSNTVTTRTWRRRAILFP